MIDGIGNGGTELGTDTREGNNADDLIRGVLIFFLPQALLEARAGEHRMSLEWTCFGTGFLVHFLNFCA